jgi:CheY-like chemotaxis protein
MSRILIVEDDPAILCGLKDKLEFESHQVLPAADGEAGCRAVWRCGVSRRAALQAFEPVPEGLK